MLWGAVIGAVIAAVIEGVAQKMRGEELDWSKIGQAALVGAVTGLVGGFVAGALLKAGGVATATGTRAVVTRVAAGAAGGATAGATDRMIHNRLEDRPLLEGVPESAALGAGVGAVAAPLAGPVQRLTDRTLGALRNARPGSAPSRGIVQVLEEAPPAASVVDDLVRPRFHMGAQKKHMPSMAGKGYMPGKSRLTHADPEGLYERFAGTGQPISKPDVAKFSSGYKERVDFGEVIGEYVEQGSEAGIPTTRGWITYSKNGAHIIPARP